MARVSEAEVLKIIAIDTNVITDTTPFINSANLIVDRIEALGILSDEEEKDVELWLSAHFMAIVDPRAETEKAGSVSQKYFGKTALRFDVTRYGQQAIIMDRTGYLEKLNKGEGVPTPSITMMP